jgi:hypothetical protein
MVDFPTLGRPTIPQLRGIFCLSVLVSIVLGWADLSVDEGREVQPEGEPRASYLAGVCYEDWIGSLFGDGGDGCWMSAA